MGDNPWRVEAVRFRFKFSIALKFDRQLGSSVTEMPAKIQSDTLIITSNLAASRLHEILRLDGHLLSEYRPLLLTKITIFLKCAVVPLDKQHALGRKVQLQLEMKGETESICKNYFCQSLCDSSVTSLRKKKTSFLQL